jgi:hypothetical protein
MIMQEVKRHVTEQCTQQKKGEENMVRSISQKQQTIAMMLQM